MTHASTKVTRLQNKSAKPAADRRRTPTKYKNEVTEALHRSASALHRVGAMDGQTMRNFDVTCIERPARWDKTRVRKLRLRLHMSQPILAAYLNSTPSTVAQWESGAKRPSGIAAKLLHVLAKHGPDVLK
jgi:putative transcriptional regulator